MSQSGLGGSKMIPNDQFNLFLIIWGHFGTSWNLFDHITQNLIFCLKNTKCFLAKVIWSKKSSFVWNDKKESKWAQNGPKWSKTCYIDHLGSFWTLLDHFGGLASMPCLANFGPTRAILDPPAHMIEGWQWPKLFHTNLVYVSGRSGRDKFQLCTQGVIEMSNFNTTTFLNHQHRINL